MRNIKQHLKYLFPVLIIIMIGGLLLSRMDQPDSIPPDPEIRIEAAEAKEHIGTAAEVCGKVESADYLPQVNGEPVFLNLVRPYPNQMFTAVIWGRDRNKWNTPPEHHYANRRICVTGVIELHEETPQIIVEYPRQIIIPKN